LSAANPLKETAINFVLINVKLNLALKAILIDGNVDQSGADEES
jgi:hypothetical protein